MNNEIHKKYMKIALEEARFSGEDIPVGAVLVKGGEVVAKAHNTKEAENDPTGHAEITVIREACKKLEDWRLSGTTLYVTLEPCPMCAAAILYSRIPEVVFGASDQLYGAFGSVLNMSNYLKFKPKIIQGVMEEECSALIKDFFKERRLP